MKSSITEMKKLLEGLNSRFELAEERNGKIADKSKEIMQSEEEKEGKMKMRRVSEIVEMQIRLLERRERKGHIKYLKN